MANELLQQEQNPVEYLKAVKESKIVLIVPNEWIWPQELRPFTNEKHKQRYDAETLAEDLEAAGLTYVLKDLRFDGWAWVAAEASR